MKVSFIYKNNTFNFNIRKDVSIISLKNKASKLIQKDKSSFDLIYKDKILTENNSTLFQIAKNETNVPILISLKDENTKKSLSKNNELEFPLLSLSNQSNPINTVNEEVENNLKLKLNESEISHNSSFSSNEMNGYPIENAGYFQSSKKLKYITRNKVFQDIYNKKEENIINLLEDLKNKILEYDDVLYQNFKNKYDKDNRQLILYENIILKFKDKQIKFLQKLVNYFNKKEATFSSIGKINLEEFYHELYNYGGNGTSNTFIQNNSMKLDKKIFINNIKPVNSSAEKFPKIPNIKSKGWILHKSIKLTNDSSYDNNDDEIIEEKKDKYLVNKKLNKEKKNEINIKQISRSNTEPELNFESTSTNKKNQKEQKEEKFQTEEKAQTEEKEEKKIQEINTSLNEENSKIDKKVENQIKKPKSNKIRLSHRDKPILDQKKINVLFEISENKDENEEIISITDSSIDNVKEKKAKKKEVIERNLRERKKTMIINPINSNIGYKSKLRAKKTTLRLKKLGNTFSDFII